jgi:hypothetical protein
MLRDRLQPTAAGRRLGYSFLEKKRTENEYFAPQMWDWGAFFLGIENIYRG